MGITKNKIKKKKKSRLVEISTEIYSEALEISKANPKDFLSVSDFVNASVRKEIDSIKYNVGNCWHASGREFAKCLACGAVFLSEKSEKGNKKRICKKCKEVIMHLHSIIKNE